MSNPVAHPFSEAVLLGLTRRAGSPTRAHVGFFFNVALAFMPATLSARPMTGDYAPRSIFSCSRVRRSRPLSYGH